MAIIRLTHPNPVFRPFTQAFSDGIHQNVTGLFDQFMMGSQSVIKEIALPFNAQFKREEFFPIGNQDFHAGFAREGHDGVQVIRHQQAEPTMPGEFGMIVCHRLENWCANIRPT